VRGLSKESKERTSFLKKSRKKLFINCGLWRQPRQRPQFIKVFGFRGRGAGFFKKKFLLFVDGAWAVAMGCARAQPILRAEGFGGE
jgi:hypothetical protein